MANLLKFSVIVPTFNRSSALAGCLKAVAALDYPADLFEIIVVNDGGAPIAELAEGLLRGISFQVINQENTGAAQARNAGSLAARGEFLLFLDDDAVPVRDWLTTWNRNIAAGTADAAGGGIRNGHPANLFSSASQMLIEYLYSYYNRGCSRQPFFASNNFCVPAAAYRKLGGFSPAFGRGAAEDRDFCDRWLNSGLSIRTVDDAIVYHMREMAAWSFWKQHFGYGKGAAIYRARRARRRKEPLRIEPISFYTGLILLPFFRFERFPRACALCCLLVVSQVANVMGFLAGKVGRSRRWRSENAVRNKRMLHWS